jgi:amino acid permease-associated region
LMMACTRSFYAMANRGEGPASHIFSNVDKVTNMPTNSAIMGVFMAALWLTYFYGANLVETSWFGNFSFDSSELPIITIYLMYIPIFFMHIRKEKELPVLQRFIMPILGIGASLFMVLAAIVSLGEKIIYYGIIFLVAMVLGCVLKGKKKEEIS